jgi:hypothetical protein
VLTVDPSQPGPGTGLLPVAAEQESHCQLLASGACREVEPEAAREGTDEEQNPGAAAEVATDVRAERCTASHTRRRLGRVQVG